MLGNKLTLRLAGRVPHVYAPRQALGRIPIAPLRAIVSVQQRTYATPGRPKGAVGEPSKTVKRAVKRAAADKSEGVTAKSATATKEASETPAVKKIVRKKPVKEKTAEDKEKDALRAAAKATRTAEVLRKADAAKLRVLALKRPSGMRRTRAINAWQVFNAEKIRGELTGKGADATIILGQASKANAAAWKALSPADREVTTCLHRLFCSNTNNF